MRESIGPKGTQKNTRRVGVPFPSPPPHFCFRSFLHASRALLPLGEKEKEKTATQPLVYAPTAKESPILAPPLLTLL